MTQKDTKILNKIIDELKSIRHRLRQMKCTRYESKINQRLLGSLNNALYHTEDLKMNLTESEHWKTIKKFVKEKHIL